ncbi:MAG: hypothetical protein QOE86_2381, partial [Solirubrobacteraceae bacterium]|nr:hypothetical protein [Solirubrobacteraceae bacterium]
MPFALRRAVAVPVLAACAVVAAPAHAPAATRPLARTAVAGRDYRAGEVVVRYART